MGSNLQAGFPLEKTDVNGYKWIYLLAVGSESGENG
jgi:hypothetical protein